MINGLMVLVGVNFLLLIFVEPFWGTHRKRWLQGSYAVFFLALAVLVVLSLITTYSAGIHGRARSLSHSLGARFNNMLELGIDLGDISGLQATIENYQRINPGISYVAVTSGGTIKIHSDPNAVGRIWTPVGNHVEYELVLKRPSADDGVPVTAIKLGIPENIIYSQLWRNIKNFPAFFMRYRVPYAGQNPHWVGGNRQPPSRPGPSGAEGKWGQKYPLRPQVTGKSGRMAGTRSNERIPGGRA